MAGITISIGAGIGLGRYGSISASTRGGGGVEPEITAYIDGLTTPLSDGQISLLNTFVKDLKSGLGISALSEAFDVMYILANETAESSLRNLVKRAHDAEAVNSPLFTALEGFGTDGAASYIDSNFKEATDGVKFNPSGSDCLMGAYLRANTFATLGTIIGSKDVGLHIIYNRNNADIRYYPNSSDSDLNDFDHICDAPYMRSAGRKTSNNIYKKSIDKVNSDEVTSLIDYVSATDFNFYIGAFNDNGTAAGFLENQFSFVFFSKYFTQTEYAIIWDAFLNYMNANGKDL